MTIRTTSPGVLIVGWLYGAWLFGINFIFHITDGSSNALELALMLGIIPAAAQLAVYRFNTFGCNYPLFYSWMFIIIILCGYTYAIQTSIDLVNAFNIVFVFIIAMLIAGCEDETLLIRLCPSYAILSSIFLLFINLTGEYSWGRLTAGSEPNFWGLVALSVGVAAFGIRSRFIAAGCWLVALLTLYNASSRGSMVAFAFAAVLFFWYWLVHSHRFHISWRVATAVIGVSAGIYLAISFSDILLKHVFAINDPRRGLGSGFTGRDQAWSEAIDVWLSAPILGVGFRKHEELMVVTRLSSHNAYLAMLADTGIVGLTMYLIFILHSIISAAAGVNLPKIRYLSLGIIVSYAILGLFERRALNAGNSFSIFFIIACYVALRQNALMPYRHWRTYSAIASRNPPVRK